jgi:TetR/AcrR family transcriptional repressor of lmrAB and yxaGH operons
MTTEPTTVTEPIVEPVAGPKRDSRDRMIRTTGRLLRKQGYHGTGLNQIVAEADAPKGSMYFHFPGGKVQLAAEAIDAFSDRVLVALKRYVEEGGSQAEGMALYLAAVADRFEAGGYDDGCAVATVAAEAAPTEPLLAEATGRALRGWVDALTTGLESEGHKAEDAHRLASVGISIIEGAIVCARGMQSPEPLRDARLVVLDLLAPPKRRRSRAEQ